MFALDIGEYHFEIGGYKSESWRPDFGFIRNGARNKCWWVEVSVEVLFGFYIELDWIKAMPPSWYEEY